jgi:hypothetical protein
MKFCVIRIACCEIYIFSFLYNVVASSWIFKELESSLLPHTLRLFIYLFSIFLSDPESEPVQQDERPVPNPERVPPLQAGPQEGEAHAGRAAGGRGGRVLRAPPPPAGRPPHEGQKGPRPLPRHAGRGGQNRGTRRSSRHC